MSDNYVYSGLGVYSSFAEKTEMQDVKKTAKPKTKVLKILVFLLTGVLVLEGLLYLVVIPATSQVRVTFNGLQSLQAAELGRELSLYCGTQWLGFDTAVAAARIASHSVVESVSVEKRFPDQVFITIKERVPVAVTFAEINGKTSPVQIDKNGVLFKTEGTIPGSSVPLISGLELDSSFDGMRLDPKFRSLLDQIALIQADNPAYFSALSEIKVLPKEYGNYELALYPLHSKVRVLTDRNLCESALQSMMLVLEMIKVIKPNVAELDLRYGAVSYKLHS
ncbi:FtsQ-type POTRA domain-containing protein [Treponema sp. OMZ 840]|uniref:cell division protein FtsQ/DivIB n=1 Tax=Treponema sp. OMZ 840 TaxID=244313 RepID=UPI003D8CFF5F